MSKGYYCCCLCGQGLRLTREQISKTIKCPTCREWGIAIPRRLFDKAPLIIYQNQKFEPPKNEKTLMSVALSARWALCLTILVVFFSLVALFVFNQDFRELVKQLTINWQRH